MKKIIDKLFLIFAIVSLIIPTYIINAEEIGTGNSGETSPTVGETTEGNQQGGETPTTPSESPAPEVPKVEAKLNSLTIPGHTLKEAFSKDNTNYTLTVKSDIQNITINATAGEGVTVTGTGSHDLKEGDNTFTITALAGSEHTTYTVKVKRSTSDLSLKRLSITGHPLNETFDPTVLNYTADVSYDTQSVIIKTGANNKDATPQISGNSNLKVGKNTVRIIVKNSSGETQEYRIIVNRLSEEEQEENDDNSTATSTSSEEVTSTAVTNVPKANDEDDNSNSGNTLKYVLVVIFCILLLVIAGLGIYFYIRTGNTEKRKQKRIEKLKKRQAKIDQELTALLPVITDEIIEEHKGKDSNNEEDFIDEDFEDTIELDEVIDEKPEMPKPRKRAEKNVLEEFDDLFLDE